MIQGRLFLLRDDNFIHGALSDLTHCRMFSFTYTLHERSSSKIHNRDTLMCFMQPEVRRSGGQRSEVRGLAGQEVRRSGGQKVSRSVGQKVSRSGGQQVRMSEG